MEENNSEQHLAVLGSSVLIDLNDGDRLTFARLHPSATVKLGNSRCSLSPLINAPYGSVFELQRGPKGPSIVRILHPKSSESQVPLEPPVKGMLHDAASPRDNRSLVDDNTAQRLSSDDIQRMRCMSGNDIVNALIANSNTFQSKTAYSQEKYKKKKQKKYAPFFVMRRPSARKICEAYLVKCPQKIGFLRMDTMALMLSLGNVAAHAEVLVMDMVGGLLSAGVAERIGGFGSVCSVYCTPKPPPIEIVGLLNLSSSMASRVFRASVWDLLSAFEKGEVSVQSAIWEEACNVETSCALNEGKVATNSGEAQEDIGMNIAEDEGGCVSLDDGAARAGDVTPGEDERKNMKQGNIRYGRRPESEDLARWVKHGFTSLLIAAPEIEPWSVAQALLPLLCSSSPFVIYHRYLQPLAHCMHELQANKMAVALEIAEPWLREYQVQLSRTHPHMQMNANGGYILSGIKIASS